MKLCQYCKLKMTNNLLSFPYFMIDTPICVKCETIIKYNYNEAIKIYNKEV